MSFNSSSVLGVNRALEWDRFVELSQLEARTEPGKDLLGDLIHPESWAPQIEIAKKMQQETLEVAPILDRDALWGPLFELSDPTDLLERLNRGAVLEVMDLVLLRRWLYAMDSWVQIPRDEIRGEMFKKAISHLLDPHDMLRILERVLTEEGELSENASPKLAGIYADIRALKREIGIVLDQLLKTFSQKGILQENFTDVRDGRYVIPIKISSQNEIDGIIYEASASRQTVFIEPREVALSNNRLRQRQNDLIQEIYIVLEATSKKLQPFVSEITRGVQTLVHWDAVQAKARVGRKYSGKSIVVTQERHFLLRQTAHPLLWWSIPAEEIIRNEIDFGADARTLLLTGPNTGGKTVLLKTLGLAGICARTGFPFPGADHPKIPFFDSFFADLGDPQSLEQHLSSFSGHVLKFKEILDRISDQSLILIDELNSATDPEEGAAFGRAVLETIMSRDAMIVTTTHDPHLKALAVNDARILNASMAFDEASRTPTFRMIFGVPGRSRALETAERLGMPAHVVELARTYLSHGHAEFERLLSKLESDSREAARARKEAVSLRDEAERLKREWTERTEASVGEMMDRTRQKLKRIIEQAQDEVRSTVRKLDDLKTRKEIDQTRSGLNESLRFAISKMETALSEEAPEIAKALHKKVEKPKVEEIPASLLEVGAQVRIPKWKSTGVIREVLGNKVKVAMGNLQIMVSKDEIEPLKGPAKIATVHTQFSGGDYGAAASEVDLRGLRYDEAISQLQNYLDQAFRSGAVEVTVIHGLGTGALREGTHKLLHSLSYVKSFRDGGTGSGGAGATIVEFDRD